MACKLQIEYCSNSEICLIDGMGKCYGSKRKCWLFEFSPYSHNVLPRIVKLCTTRSRLLTTLMKKASENTVGKGKMLVTSIFSFSHSVSYSVKERNHHYPPPPPPPPPMKWGYIALHMSVGLSVCLSIGRGRPNLVWMITRHRRDQFLSNLAQT